MITAAEALSILSETVSSSSRLMGKSLTQDAASRLHLATITGTAILLGFALVAQALEGKKT